MLTGEFRTRRAAGAPRLPVATGAAPLLCCARPAEAAPRRRQGAGAGAGAALRHRRRHAPRSEGLGSARGLRAGDRGVPRLVAERVRPPRPLASREPPRCHRPRRRPCRLTPKAWIGGAIAAGLLLAGGAAVRLLPRRPGGAPPPPRNLAILPVVNRGGDRSSIQVRRDSVRCWLISSVVPALNVIPADEVQVYRRNVGGAARRGKGTQRRRGAARRAPGSPAME